VGNEQKFYGRPEADSHPLDETDCEAFLRRNRPARISERVVRFVPGTRTVER